MALKLTLLYLLIPLQDLEMVCTFNFSSENEASKQLEYFPVSVKKEKISSLNSSQVTKTETCVLCLYDRQSRSPHGRVFWLNIFSWQCL